MVLFTSNPSKKIFQKQLVKQGLLFWFGHNKFQNLKKKDINLGKIPSWGNGPIYACILHTFSRVFVMCTIVLTKVPLQAHSVQKTALSHYIHAVCLGTQQFIPLSL